MIEVGESLLHVNVAGAGRPVVILESGIAATSLSWALIAPELAKHTTVFSYDRAGLGWSGPAMSPRTPTTIAGELREALGKAGLPGPYLLVGHSFGGLVVQRFATLYRRDVCGLVLLDPLRAKDWCPLTTGQARMLRHGIRLSRRGAVLARWGVVGASLRFLLAGNQILPKLAARLTSGSGGSGVTDRLAGEIRKLPRELWPVVAWQWSQEKNFQGMARHLECLPESAAEMSGCVVDASIPVRVLLAANASDAGFPSYWKVTHAQASGHWVQLDRPDLVIAAVLELANIGSTPR